MKAVLVVLSLFLRVAGAMMVVSVHQARERFKSIVSRSDMRFMAIPPFLLGMVLIAGAFAVREVFLLAFLVGILGIIKGAFLALGPQARIQQVKEWWLERAGEPVLRLSGLITALVGVAMLARLF